MEKGEIKNLSTKFLMYGTGKSKQFETTLFDLINGDNGRNVRQKTYKRNDP